MPFTPLCKVRCAQGGSLGSSALSPRPHSNSRAINPRHLCICEHPFGGGVCIFAGQRDWSFRSQSVTRIYHCHIALDRVSDQRVPQNSGHTSAPTQLYKHRRENKPCMACQQPGGLSRGLVSRLLARLLGETLRHPVPLVAQLLLFHTTDRDWNLLSGGAMMRSRTSGGRSAADAVGVARILSAMRNRL